MNLRYGIATLTLVLAATPAGAQTTFLAGGSVGMETLPSVLVRHTSCAALGEAAWTPGGEARLGLSLANGLGVEARAGLDFALGAELECATLNVPTTAQPLPQRLTLYDPLTEARDRISFLDLRLRQELHEGRTVLTLGPGLIQGGPFYLAASVGRRWDVPLDLGVHRWGFDVEAAGYRMAWQRSEVDLFDDPDLTDSILVEELAVERMHLWEVGFGIRGVVEFGFH